jgi:hypothetical protein
VAVNAATWEGGIAAVAPAIIIMLLNCWLAIIIYTQQAKIESIT